MTTSLPGPGVARVHGAVLTGIHAEIIEVQATVAGGAPGFAIIGVPGDGTREMRDRVRAAVLNSGLAWPSGGITVSLGSPRSALNKSHFPMINVAKPQVSCFSLDRKHGYSVAS